jgi:hypothetical protein
MTLGLFDYRAKTHRILRAAEKPEEFLQAFSLPVP